MGTFFGPVIEKGGGISDGTDVHGVGIFDAEPEAVREIMDEDPGVRQGVFVYEVHPCRGFPGDKLP